MEHWGIYIAYAWLATIIWALTDAVQAIRKGRSLSPRRHTSTTNEWKLGAHGYCESL
jgi:hypothetical protein